MSGRCECDVCESLRIAEAEIARLRAEVERLRNGAPDARETVTDHDAAPAARVSADRERPDNPPARPGDGTGTTHTLTDAERQAVEWFAKFGNASLATFSNAWTDHAATLRRLLARLGGDA